MKGKLAHASDRVLQGLYPRRNDSVIGSRLWGAGRSPTSCKETICPPFVDRICSLGASKSTEDESNSKDESWVMEAERRMGWSDE